MAGLTKQHFIEIASIINSSVNNDDKKDFTIDELRGMNGVKEYIAFKLSDYFKTQNPLFNENQFKKACLE